MTDQTSAAISSEWAKRWLCHFLGHKIVDVAWHYEQGQTLALVGGEELSVPVTWACCEACSRCGEGIWVPW